MDYTRLLGDIGNGKIAHLYLLVGDDPYLRREAARLVAGAFLGEEGGERLTPAGASLGEAVRELRTPLLGGGRRLVEIELTRSECPVKDLKGYLAKPPRDACLVIDLGEILRRDQRKLKYPQENLVICNRPYTNEMSRIVHGLLNAAGLQLDRAGVGMVAEAAGTSVGTAERIVETLGSYAGEERRLDSSEIGPLLGSIGVHSVFDLTDAVASGRPTDAMRALQRALRQGEVPERLMALLSSHLLDLWRAARAIERGETPSLSGAPFYRDKVTSQARSLGAERAARLLQGALTAEKRTRAGRGPIAEAMREMLAGGRWN